MIDGSTRMVRMTANIQSRSGNAARPSLEDCRQAGRNGNNPYSLVETVSHKAEIQEGFRGFGLPNIVHLPIQQIKTVPIND